MTSFPGSGNEVIQDGGRKRKGRHFPPPPQWGSKNSPYTTFDTVYRDIMQPLCILSLFYMIYFHSNALVCHQRYLYPPLEGVSCVHTEVLLNITNVPRHLCTWHCMRHAQCEVMTYNVVTKTCTLGPRHCLYFEEISNVITTLVAILDLSVPPDNFDGMDTSSSGPPPPPVMHTW